MKKSLHIRSIIRHTSLPEAAVKIQKETISSWNDLQLLKVLPLLKTAKYGPLQLTYLLCR